MAKRSLLARLKEFIFTPLSGPQFGLARIPRTNFNYAQEVGDGMGSSVLMSPIKFIQRNFPEAVLEVSRMTTNGKPEAVPDHAMTALIRRPNPYYTSAGLWAGTLFSYLTHGNGYWLKIRGSNRQQSPWPTNVTGEVQELWYAPHWMIYPRWPFDGSVFISHYRYVVDGKSFDVAPENVVHFRCGLDPRNPRLGLSPIESELREIFSDDEAANMMASLCRNMGVPGLIVSPDGDATAGEMDAAAVKDELRRSTTGDRRGEPLVFRTATKVEQFGFDPHEMNMSSVRDTAEERICAALGIPPSVVGFATDQTRVGATMMELRKQAWEGGIIPLQAVMADQLELSLLPEFESKPERCAVRFNYANVAAMQQNQGDLISWVDKGVRGGWLRVDHGQTLAGFEADSTQAVYLRNAYTIEIPAESTERPTPPGQSRNEPNVGASQSPKALKASSAKAVRSFIRTQAAEEKRMMAAMQPLFENERQAVLDACETHFDEKTLANGTWIRTALDEQSNDWAAMMSDTMLRGMKAGWQLLGKDLGRNYKGFQLDATTKESRRKIATKTPVTVDTQLGVTTGLGFDVFEPRAVEYAATQAGLKVTGILDTTVLRLQSLVERAIQEGWSLKSLTDEVESLYDGFTTMRAETIARTETAAAINYGKHQAALETETELGLKLQREWIAVEDERTRESHAIADGQKRKLGELYNVGGYSMMHPHDMNAPASETINCRCSETFEEIPA